MLSVLPHELELACQAASRIPGLFSSPSATLAGELHMRDKNITNVKARAGKSAVCPIRGKNRDNGKSAKIRQIDPFKSMLPQNARKEFKTRKHMQSLQHVQLPRLRIKASKHDGAVG